jgi:NhaP-type Na+/H+ or K+/H+ antiporter
MLFSIALMMIIGFLLSGIFNRLKLPGLLGMIITGIILGPYVLDLIASDLLNISKDLREIALIVILIRAGLSLDLRDLKKVGRPAILMCFVPATIEILTVVFLAPIIFNISYIEAAIMGTVLAAVSPAVVVPRMIKLIESGHGKDKSIPQLILAGASVDDIYVIILFTAFMGMYKGAAFDSKSLITVPISIILGLFVGIIVGLVLVYIFKKIHMRDTVKVFIILSLSFLIVSLETYIQDYVPMSGLLGVMALGGTILEAYGLLARRIIGKFSKIWVGAELLLFILVGAAVDIRYLAHAGIGSVAIILLALLGRIIAVNISLLKTPLNMKERLFCSIAYMPKATVQAAIGAIPLTAGVASGNLILTIAVLSIMITAPIGAIGIDRLHPRLLNKIT